jgi:Zn-dependent protease
MKFQVTVGALVPAAAILAIGISRFGWLRGTLAGLLLMISLLLHEVGHISVAFLTGTRVEAAGICLKGPYIRRQVACTRGADLSIASAGLVVNVLIIIAFWNTTGILHWLAGLNAYLAASNLLPIGGSDGQRILRLLCGHGSNATA